MTTDSDTTPWRERNLERLAEARRILEEARGLRPHPDADEGSGEPNGGDPPDPEYTNKHTDKHKENEL